MITVFARNYYTGCTTSAYSAIFDGINDAALTNVGNHFPSAYSRSGVQTKVVFSMWIKQDWTLSNVGNNIRFFISQTASAVNDGDVDNQFIRIGYGAKNGSGSSTNKLFVTYRGDGTSNQIEKIYNIHSAANSSITGSTSNSDYWTSDNTNINVNDNGFVHICAIMNLPAYNVTNPESFSAGSINTYWNGSLLTHTNYNVSGFAQQDSNYISGMMGGNIATLGNLFQGKIDELQVLSDDLAQVSAFKTAYSLTSDQDIATTFYNDGCPLDTTDHTSANSWNYYNYKFENNWNAEGASTYPMTPANGATFSTDHA